MGKIPDLIKEKWIELKPHVRKFSQVFLRFAVDIAARSLIFMICFNNVIASPAIPPLKYYEAIMMLVGLHVLRPPRPPGGTIVINSADKKEEA